MTRRLAMLLTATGLLAASVAAASALAARPSNSVIYAVQATIEQTVKYSMNATGSPQTDPRQTCGRAAITGKVDAKGKFYVAEFRSRLRRPLVATKPNFGGAFEGLHPSLPLNGQIVISTDLQEATAEECDGQQFPAERCEQTLPVRKMEFSPMGTPGGRSM